MRSITFIWACTGQTQPPPFFCNFFVYFNVYLKNLECFFPTLKCILGLRDTWKKFWHKSSFWFGTIEFSLSVQFSFPKSQTKGDQTFNTFSERLRLTVKVSRMQQTSHDLRCPFGTRTFLSVAKVAWTRRGLKIFPWLCAPLCVCVRVCVLLPD